MPLTIGNISKEENCGVLAIASIILSMEILYPTNYLFKIRLGGILSLYFLLSFSIGILGLSD